MGFPERVTLWCTWALEQKRVMLLASPFPLTSVPALRSHLCVALSSDTVKSKIMIPFWLVIFKRLAGRLLWPGLAGENGYMHFSAPSFGWDFRPPLRNVSDACVFSCQVAVMFLPLLLYRNIESKKVITSFKKFSVNKKSLLIASAKQSFISGHKKETYQS